VLLLLTVTHLAGPRVLSTAAPSVSEIEERADSASMPLGEVLTGLEARVEAMEAGRDSLVEFHRTHVKPLIDVLTARTNADSASIERAALALVREGHEAGVDPRLLTAVLLVENPWLDPDAESSMGAVGLMQVMPFHAGNWGCAGSDLTNPDTNICHGPKILAELLRRSRWDLDRALLRYNGCVHGANTPDCHEYPQWVYGRAGPAWMAEIDRDRGRTPQRTATPTS
jgi:hypothetical protein